VIFIFMTPLVVCYLLNLILHFSTKLNQSGVIEWGVESIDRVKHCDNGLMFNPSTDEECVSVGYSIIGKDADL